MHSIGALSRHTGIKIPTIRYYEQVGLVAAPDRTEGNQRRYTDKAVMRLGFIKNARNLGFSIDAIRELIDLSDHPEKSCSDATRIAREQLGQVQARIAQLRRLETELRRISTGCPDSSSKDCHVLNALAERTLLAEENPRL
ncbi:MerR family transcriptional regulator [Nisaea sediminum]|uniref:MerR family transcriptional regulator n=1 Tax=Nisaea sediminum TaxID=2775867 RepID=UPI001865E24C|nr:helix-turn-helix domain-containing protein [Nisaea sediminum]